MGDEGGEARVVMERVQVVVIINTRGNFQRKPGFTNQRHARREFCLHAWGTDSGYSQTAQGGVFTVTGTSMSGATGQNDFGSVTTNQSFTGTFSAADSFGRGAFKIAGGTSLINYYIVGPEAIRMIQVNTNASAGDSAFGQGSGAFSAASLGASLLVLQGNPWSSGIGALGQFKTSNLLSNPSSFACVGDDNKMGNGVYSAPAATSGLYPGSAFNATLALDTTHPGRYPAFTLTVTNSAGTGKFQVVTYQVSGKQLYWLEVCTDSVWVGSLQQQGSLTGLP
ncbi:MAG TPA: hypothetical protein VFU55_11270 [Terracidiphilus sp.]|nr:hypothetical protein [Terracidiphilus sp.]